MKSSAAILLSCVAFVTANFDLYIGQQTGTTPEGGNEDMWNIYPSDPSCSDVYTARNYFEEDDVSQKIGVRCDGAGCFGGNSPADVDVWRCISVTIPSTIGAIFDGVRKFRCITEFTVDQIEAAE
ncbi:hypothetical protein H9Q69_006443 [Fusarium xylarioides]|nr:hypothetical protein H9Q69_006443 [Fusarium xylarioides]